MSWKAVKWDSVIYLLLLCVVSPFSEAHRFAPSYLHLQEQSANQFTISWKTPRQTASQVPLQPVLPNICEKQSEPAVEFEGSGVLSQWQIACDRALWGESISVSGLASNNTASLLSIEFAEGEPFQTVLTAKNASFTFEPKPSFYHVFLQYAVLGVQHILEGADHLLFVAGLFLLVGWQKQLLWTITAFTLGHSVTLSLVALGYLTFPVALLEFMIALSVFYLAVALSYQRMSCQRKGYKHKGERRNRSSLWLAAGFGLFHGMGFAGVLAEIGLPEQQMLPALVAFNVGIEIGQLLFIAIIAVVWRLLAVVLKADGVILHRVPQYVLGSLAVVWCIERGIEVYIEVFPV